MSNNQLLTGMSDPPYRNNLIKDQDGQEMTPGFAAIVTQIWYGFFRTLVQWANMQGATQTIPYASSDYAKVTGVGAWTVGSGDLTSATYRLVGNTLTVNYTISNSTIGAGNMLLGRILLPDVGIGTYIITETVTVPARIVSGGVSQVGGTAQVVSTDNRVLIFCDAAMPAGTDNFDVSFSISFGVQRQ